MATDRRDKLWRIAGVSIWTSSLVLWIVLWFFNPYASTGETITIPGMVMILVALFGVFASMKGSGMGQLLASLGSILPIGLYVLGSPGLFAFIGVLNIVAIIPAGYFLVFGRATNLSKSAENR
ncbi:MAG: hypothetical protein EXR84_06395 [Gammaproteobacteria bacterium]|nr:hypothetical protein [Gammaproteobacteria bacterium]